MLSRVGSGEELVVNGLGIEKSHRDAVRCRVAMPDGRAVRLSSGSAAGATRRCWKRSAVKSRREADGALGCRVAARPERGRLGGAVATALACATVHAWRPHRTRAARAPQHGVGTARDTAIGVPETGTPAKRARRICHFEHCWRGWPRLAITWSPSAGVVRPTRLPHDIDNSCPVSLSGPSVQCDAGTYGQRQEGDDRNDHRSGSVRTPRCPDAATPDGEGEYTTPAAERSHRENRHH